MDSFGRILVAFREKIRLDDSQVLDRRLVIVDDDVIDALERGEIHGAQILRYERTEVRLVDVRIGGQARDEDIRVILGIHQMPNVTRMHQIECAVAHDDFVDPRARSDCFTQLLSGLDLPVKRIFLRGNVHAVLLSRNVNQFFVAPAIDTGSQTGAWRQ